MEVGLRVGAFFVLVADPTSLFVIVGSCYFLLKQADSALIPG